jgi:hypothetical protein
MDALRDAAQRTEGENGLVHSLRLDRETTDAINKEEIRASALWLAQSRYGWAHIMAGKTQRERMSRVIDSFRIQVNSEPSERELNETGQRLIAKRVDELDTAASGLRTAIAIVRDGKHVLPSQPQYAPYLMQYTKLPKK